MSTWSDRISDLRATGMSLAEIGEAVGLSVSSVCDIEKRRTLSPRGEAALKLHSLHSRKCKRVSRSTAA